MGEKQNMLWLNKIGKFLENENLSFEPYKKLPAFSLGFKGDEGRINMLIFTSADQSEDQPSYVVIIAYMPIPIDYSRIGDILPWINEKNSRFTTGNFEIRPEDDQVIFKLGTRIWPGFQADHLRLLIDMAATEAYDIAPELMKFAKL
ncbi:MULTISPECIES: hypothetical protein [unclassified Delftia]|uniref:hypothetical protein n=1 Tax=unclassified Delftia TaxID=2613839 RepID=UPI0018FF4FE3|nr:MULTISPECIES: hypothetical protein [unclassified Delftia]MBK0115641.1 hypothetical protein [Delftia sp. S65]MBK0119502.1 hypothetical protein [Delftia sp. S67]MBK0130194.1 hypothetical protein [Delftia sp. S66]